MKIKQLLSEEVQQALLELSNYTSSCALYEHKDSRLLYSIPNQLRSKGGIDLRGTKVYSTDDVAQLCKAYRDERFETFRIIFVKGHTIVGSQGVTSKIPDYCAAQKKFNNSPTDYDVDSRTYESYKRTMERLGADGYYLVHNHPSGVVKPSDYDFSTTHFFKLNVPGFISHIIVGRNKYCNFTVDTDNHTASVYEGTLDNLEDREVVGTVNGRDALRDFIKKFPTKDNSSLIVYSDSHNTVTAVEEMNDTAFNDKTILRYIQKQKTEHGAARAFLYTDNSDIFDIGLSGYPTVFSDVLLNDEDRYLDHRDDGNYSNYVRDVYGKLNTYNSN